MLVVLPKYEEDGSPEADHSILVAQVYYSTRSDTQSGKHCADYKIPALFSASSTQDSVKSREAGDHRTMLHRSGNVRCNRAKRSTVCH
jgi:hypothetical protein